MSLIELRLALGVTEALMNEALWVLTFPGVMRAGVPERVAMAVNSLSGTPADWQAVVQALRKSPTGSPARWKTSAAATPSPLAGMLTANRSSKLKIAAVATRLWRGSGVRGWS
jgi:hypothetical protein